jgi:hypothetical protein
LAYSLEPTSTELAPDPAGTWVVSYVSRPDEQGRGMVFLKNPARPDDLD